MPFSVFADFLEDITKSAETMFARIKDRDTFRRVVGAGFLIARADGNFDADERAALAKLIANKLPQFKLADIVSALERCSGLIDFDATSGRLEILDDIAKAKGDTAEMIVRTAIYIGGADGHFDDDEKAEARIIAERLLLDPAKYGM